jgi:hypothetical protein
MMNRRSLILSIPLLTDACTRRSFASLVKRIVPVTQSEIDALLDTTHPERHCTANHDHNDTRFDDWEGSLKWAAANCGHNEGAGAVIKLAVKNGLKYPELMCGCLESENLIPRVNEVLKNPDVLDRYAAYASASQIATLKRMLRQGVSPAEVLASAPEQAVGEAWRRKAMMRFASTIAKKGSLAPATAIATASQWHNCQAFRSLLRHSSEVSDWLMRQETKDCSPRHASYRTLPDQKAI